MILKLQKNLLNKKKYTVFLIGLGKSGYGNLKNKPSYKSHYYYLTRSKNLSIKYLFDLNSNNLNKVKNLKKENKISQYHQFRNIKKTDITVISVPTDANLQVVRQLKKFKILSNIVILEKPVSTNLKTFKKIEKILKNKIIFVNFQRSWNIFYDNIFKDKKNLNIYHIYNNGFLNNCSHMIALLMKYFGKWKSYKFLFKNNSGHRDPNYSLILYFKNNNRCILNGVSNSKTNVFETLIYEENRIIELKSGAINYNERNPKKFKHIKNYYLLNEKNEKNLQINDNPYIGVSRLLEEISKKKVKIFKMDNFPSLPIARNIITLAKNLKNDKKI